MTQASPGSRSTLLWPLILIVLAVVFALPTLDEPFGRDQGVYAAVADIIRDGGLPYVNAWDHKPPGIYYVYAWVFDLFGRSMFGIRLFDLVFALVVMGAVYALAARAYDATVGKVAAFLVVFVYFCDTHYDHRAEADSVMMLPLTLSALCMVRAGPGRRRLAWLAGASFFAGISVWLKLTAAFTALAFGIVLVVEAVMARERAGRVALEIAVYVLGAAVALGAVLLYAWKMGFLGAMLEIVIGFNAEYYSSTARAAGGAIGILKLVLQTTSWWPYLILPSLVTAVAMVMRRRRAELVVLAFALSAAAAILVQGKLWAYHWMAAFPAWGVMAGAAYVQAGRRMSWRGLSPVADNRNLLLAVMAITLAVWALAAWAQRASESIALHTGRMSLARFYGGEIRPGAYQERFGRYRFGDFSYWADDEVASYLREHTRPGDRVYIWGFEPLIYFLADRRPASRFLMDHPLEASFKKRDAWRAELLDDLRRYPPVYFIVASGDIYELEREESTVQLQRFEALYRFVQRHYQVEATIEDFTIMRRVDGGS